MAAEAIRDPAMYPRNALEYARAHRRQFLAALGAFLRIPSISSQPRHARDVRRCAEWLARHLGRIGLDDGAARIVITALDGDDVAVRAAAPGALRGWRCAGDNTADLVRHLDDDWPVALCAARTLQSIGGAGRRALESQAARADLAGVLARQMLWEVEARA